MSKWHEQAAAFRSLADSERRHADEYERWANAPETLDRHRQHYADEAAKLRERAAYHDTAADRHEARAEEWEDEQAGEKAA